MTYKIEITSRARRDMERAVDYIEFSLNNPNAADALLNEISKTISSLSYMPERYALPEDELLASWGIRFVRIKNYLAFYQVDKDTSMVFVIRFLHGKRDWVSILHESL